MVKSRNEKRVKLRLICWNPILKKGEELRLICCYGWIFSSLKPDIEIAFFSTSLCTYDSTKYNDIIEDRITLQYKLKYSPCTRSCLFICFYQTFVPNNSFIMSFSEFFPSMYFFLHLFFSPVKYLSEISITLRSQVNVKIIFS